jgi:hypothetical protein
VRTGYPALAFDLPKDMPKPSVPIAARSGAPCVRLVAILVMLSVTPVQASAAAVGRSPSYDGFRAFIGERFRVYGGTGAREVVSLRLIEVSERHQDTHTETFSVRFQGPPDRPLSNGVYTFEHPRSGTFELFLEAAGSEADGLYYRAGFNLMVEDAARR